MYQTLNSLTLSSGSKLKLTDGIFSNEIFSVKKLNSSVIAKLTFNNITFEKVQFIDSASLNCQFNHCIFHESSLTKLDP